MNREIKKYGLCIVSFLFLTACQKTAEPLETPSGKLKPIQTITESDDIEGELDAKADIKEKATSMEYDILCKKDGNVDDVFVEKVNQELNKLPQNIKTAFLKDGWDIYVTDMDINLTYYDGKYGGVMGSTNYREGRILIEDREEAVTQAPLHEIGHWLDFHHGYITDTNPFLNVFASDYGSFVNAYDISTIYDRKELFAEGFWQYIINPQKLEMTAPNLYWFLKDIVSET